MSPPRTVYLASPLSGDVERNQNYARAAMKDSLGRGEAPFVPHLLYTQVLDDTKPEEREAGMRAGTAILLRCDAVVIYVDLGISRGMQAEMDAARAAGIVVEERRLPTLAPPPRPSGLETDAGTIRYRVTERGPHAVAIAVFLEAEWRRDYEPAGKSRLDMHNNYVVEAMFAQGAL